MRLTEPGVYVARDRRVAMSYVNEFDDLFFSIRTNDAISVMSANDVNTDGDWQRIDLDAIEWAELPPRPLLLYASLDDEKEAIWWHFCESRGWTRGNGFVSRCRLTVVPHPDNDPEAVAMIEAARKETNG